ncbi:MAG: hypothetical protein QXN55_00770 [Candidatus Nitrosotenuis sp.]
MTAQQLLECLLHLQSEGLDLKALDVVTVQSRTDEEYNFWTEEAWPLTAEVDNNELRIY